MGTKLIKGKMVFALVGGHVPSPQAKLHLDRTAKLQGDVNLFSFLRDLFTIKNTKTNKLGTKLIIEKVVFALVGKHVPSPQAKLQIDRTAKLQGDVFLFSFLRDLFTILTQKYK